MACVMPICGSSFNAVQLEGDSYFHAFDDLLNDDSFLPRNASALGFTGLQQDGFAPSGSLVVAFDSAPLAPAAAAQPFGRAGFGGGALTVAAPGMLFGGPDTPPQQQLLPVQPAQFGTWMPEAMPCLQLRPDEQAVLPPFNAKKVKKVRKARSRASQKQPKPPRDKGVVAAWALFGSRSRKEPDAPVLQAASGAAAALPAAMLASAPPADDAAERMVRADADDCGLQPAALLAAVDLSSPPSEGDAEQDKTMLSLFFSESSDAAAP